MAVHKSIFFIRGLQASDQITDESHKSNAYGSNNCVIEPGVSADQLMIVHRAEWGGKTAPSAVEICQYHYSLALNNTSYLHRLLARLLHGSNPTLKSYSICQPYGTKISDQIIKLSDWR